MQGSQRTVLQSATRIAKLTYFELPNRNFTEISLFPLKTFSASGSFRAPVRLNLLDPIQADHLNGCVCLN